MQQEKEDELSYDFIHLSQLINTPMRDFNTLLCNILEKCANSDNYKLGAFPNLHSLAKQNDNLRSALERLSESKISPINEIANEILHLLAPSFKP